MLHCPCMHRFCPVSKIHKHFDKKVNIYTFFGEVIWIPMSIHSGNYSWPNCVPSLSQLLNRVFNIMREKNPDMVAGEKRKFVMKPPQVVRVGTKKTSFVNFTDICKL